MQLNANLSEQVKVVEGLIPTVPSTSTPDYVSLKNFERVMILIIVKNATTVTGSAITLKQATNVAASGEKALAFTNYWSNIDTATADVLAAQTAVSNTFTTNNTNSKNLMYIIEVKAEDLDVNNGFDCIRAGTGDATAATVGVYYFLYGAKFPTTVSAIID